MQVALPGRADPDRVRLRSVWRWLDADHFEVRRELAQDDGWKTELTVQYQREPEASAR